MRRIVLGMAMGFVVLGLGESLVQAGPVMTLGGDPGPGGGGGGGGGVSNPNWVEIMHRNFDNGLDPADPINGDWSTIASSASAYEGTRGLDIPGPSLEGGDTISFFVDLTGLVDGTFEGYEKVKSAYEATDSTLIRARENGGDWVVLLTKNAQGVGTWSPFEVVLPDEFDGSPQVEIQIVEITDSGGERKGYDSFVFGGTRAVPEPATLALLGTGAIAIWRRRQQQ